MQNLRLAYHLLLHFSLEDKDTVWPFWLSFVHTAHRDENMLASQVSANLVKMLTSFGLTENEAKTYIALLRLHQGPARSIAKLADIPRQEAYRVLPELMKKGLVVSTITKPEQFIAVTPSEVLSQLIDRLKDDFAKRISNLEQRREDLEVELKKIEGKSSGFSMPHPVHYVLISGVRLVNERVEEMLARSERQVLWVSPKLEVRRAVIYDRDEMLRKCAKRAVKIRILTELGRENLEEIKRLSMFAQIRNVPNLTSLMTIIDDKEIMIGSAVHSSDNDLIHELWTNDPGQVNTMLEFFERVWSEAKPVTLTPRSRRPRTS
jgi:sugar-specific transcriptional regulator TrmB